MSIDSAGKIFDWIQGDKLSKALFAVIFVTFCLLLFEQHTGHYRLSRLEKTITMLKSLEPGVLRDQVQADFTQQANILFSPKQVSPWPVRVLCGGFVFIIGCVLIVISKEGLLNCISPFALGLGVGGCIALIPDFCPTWKECLIAGLFPLLFLILRGVDGFNQESEAFIKDIQNLDKSDAV